MKAYLQGAMARWARDRRRAIRYECLTCEDKGRLSRADEHGRHSIHACTCARGTDWQARHLLSQAERHEPRPWSWLVCIGVYEGCTHCPWERRALCKDHAHDEQSIKALAAQCGVGR